MPWYAPASGRRGRQHIFSDASIQFCLSIKCLFGLALRQSLGWVERLLRMAGLDWKAPDFSTVSRRQKTLRVQWPYRASTTALDLLVDSTGIKFLGEGEWKRKKHRAEYRRQWRKVHLGIDANTLEIRAIEVGDAPMLPEWLGQIPPQESGAHQDALLQAPGRAGDGAHVCTSGGGSGSGVACAGSTAQPIHATRTPDHGSSGGHGVAASAVGVISSRFRMDQQSPWTGAGMQWR
jgi:hypothetical protein